VTRDRSPEHRVRRAVWEARFWTVFGLLGCFVRPLRESIPVLFFLSAYANAKASMAEAEAARATE
jgi:hypothetical protein